MAGDLGTPPALEELVDDCSAVIHCAGAVRGNSQAAFDQVNVAGTAALVKAVKAQSNPPRFLMLSSLAAREPQLSWYAHSKRDAEQLLEQEQELDWVIVRPPPVYGPGDKEMLPVFQMMARGIALVPGSPDARMSLIHVSDLVTAIEACLQSAATKHRVLPLGDGKTKGYDWREMADIAASTWSRRVRLWCVPQWLLNGVASLNTALAGLTGTAPMLTPPKLRELRHNDWVVDNQAITTATNWTPHITLHEGLKQLKNCGI